MRRNKKEEGKNDFAISTKGGLCRSRVNRHDEVPGGCPPRETGPRSRRGGATTLWRVLSLVSFVVAVVALAGCDSARREFDKAREANTEQSYRQFLEAYPNHTFSPQAKSALETVLLDSALKSGDEKSLEKFISEFPESQRLQEAKAKIESLALASARKSGTIEAYEAFLGRFPDGSQAAVAQGEIDALIQKKIYRWKTLRKEGARDVQVMEIKGHVLEIKAISKSSRVPATMNLDGSGARFFVEGLGSRNVKVKIGKDIGYTTYAGLKFKVGATVNIWRNGIVEVDREGIEALDEKGRRITSRRITIKEKDAVVMIERF